MNDNNSNTSKAGGVGFLGLLALIFITLKLTGVIGWSWLWVLAPLWIPAALVVAIIVILFIVMLVKEVVATTKSESRKLDREAAALGIERGKGETDQALAYRIKRLKDLTGRTKQ